MKVIPYIIYLYILALHYTILTDLVSIYGSVIDLAVLMVVLVAIYKDEITSLWFAISVGIVAGSQRFELMPWEILILAGIALLINYISTRADLGAITTRLIILGGFLLIHKSVITLLSSNEAFAYMIYRYILPSTIYSLFPGWLFFLIIDGRITWRKIKAQF